MKDILIAVLIVVMVVMAWTTVKASQDASEARMAIRQQERRQALMLDQQRRLQMDADQLNTALNGAGVVRAFGMPNYKLMPDGTIVAPPIGPSPLETEWALTVMPK